MVSRVADILMEQGRQAVQQAGRGWGVGLEQIGQEVGQAGTQLQEQKARQKRLDLDTAHLGLLQQEEVDRVAALKRTREGQALTADLVGKNSKFNPDTGHYEYDHEAVINGLLSGGHPEAAGHYADLGTKIDDFGVEAQTKHLALEAHKKQGYVDIFGAIANAPEDEREARYGTMLAALPPNAKNDPVFGKLPPIYPGHQAFTALYEAQQTDAQRTAKQEKAAKDYREGLKEIPPGGKLVHVGPTGEATTLAEGGAKPEDAAAEARSAETARHNLATEGTGALTASRALAAQQEQARHNRAQEGLSGQRIALGPTGASALADVKESVTAMREGTAPPMLPGRATKEYLATIAEAHRQKFDIASAAIDWTATQKHISSMNSTQQLKLNQSINALPEMLDKVDTLASKWKGGRFPILNKANLALAKGGAYGQDVASVANQLDAQIADVTADLGNVYMGGNSPTDHALGLAAKSLSGDWSEKVLHDMTDLARNNVKIRSNSIKHTGVAGASAANPYGTQASEASAAAPAGVPANVAKALKGAKPGRHTLSDGSVWMLDASGAITK